MDDDEDDFFAHQAAKSLHNKRSQLKQFFQAPVISAPLSSSSNTESDDENDLIPPKKPKAASSAAVGKLASRPVAVPAEPPKSKDAIRSEIDAIVSSCFTSAQKEVKRRVKLGKRTEADDQEGEEEDEYVTRLTRQQRHGHLSRSMINALNKSQLDEDDEKVTRETAAYTRLDAVLRVTKPLCEKQLPSSDEEDETDDDDDDDERSAGTDRSFGIGDIPSLNKITLKIDHSDGRQLTLSLSSATTLKSLYQQVAEGLGLPAVSLVFNDQTLKLDEHHQSMSLKQLQFSSDNVQSLESYPVINKLKIYIQTSSNRRSSLGSKRQYTMLATDRFETIFDAYKRDMKATNIRFEFDGDTLDPRATPNDYEMVDGEILDAFILTQTSNKGHELVYDEDTDD